MSTHTCATDVLPEITEDELHLMIAGRRLAAPAGAMKKEESGLVRSQLSGIAPSAWVGGLLPGAMAGARPALKGAPVARPVSWAGTLPGAMAGKRPAAPSFH